MDEPVRVTTKILMVELACLRRAGVRYVRAPQLGNVRARRPATAGAQRPSARSMAAAPSHPQGSELTLPKLDQPNDLVLPHLNGTGATAPSRERRPKESKGADMLQVADGWDTPPLTTNEKLAKLAELEQRVSQCTRCPELVKNRTQTVFGVGNPDAELCFVGEAPGADEDRLGEPFVGRAGQLLTRMIEAMGMNRADVYICNVLKCRPPQNRTPTITEVRNCADYLDEQLEIIKPAFICCLGSVAAQRLIPTTGAKSPSLSRLRGRVFRYKGAKVIVTYHPAYLLRTESAKKDAWQDLKLLLREMGRPIPSRRKT